MCGLFHLVNVFVLVNIRHKHVDGIAFVVLIKGDGGGNEQRGGFGCLPIAATAGLTSGAHSLLLATTTAITTTAVAGPFYTSGLHIPVKLPPFDPKQPKQWFQQADTIFWWSQVVSSQDKWDYTLPKLPTDILNNISDVVDSLTDATPNPYELAKNRLLETYTPTLAACSAALDISPCSWCVFRHAGESAVVTVAAWGLTGHYVPRPPPGQQ